MISIVLPTFNESESIINSIQRIHKLMESSSIPHEILVVDDDSPDGTWSVAQEMIPSVPNLKVYRRLGERGLSSAILFGFGLTQGEYILVMDADGQHDEEEIPQFWNKLKKDNLDLVVGSRKIGGNDYGEMPYHRKMLSKLASKIASWIHPLPVKDTMSGYFLLRKSSLVNDFHKLNPRGFKILLEILVKFPDLKTTEMPYRFKRRMQGKTKLSSFVVLEYLLSLLEMKYKIRFSPVFIRYSIVGIMGIFVNLISQFFFDRLLPNRELNFPENLFLKPSLSVVLGFEISLLHNFFWNHFWTFRNKKVSLLSAIVKFHLVSLFSFFIQLSTWYYIYSIWIGSTDSPTPYATNISNLIGILIAFISNYLLNRNLTWKKETEI